MTFNSKALNNPSTDDFQIDQTIEFVPLGIGKITSVDRQQTLTKGKYNLILEALLESGQSILVSKLFDESKPFETEKELPISGIDALVRCAKEKLNPRTFEFFQEYLSKQKKISNSQIELYLKILNNDD